MVPSIRTSDMGLRSGGKYSHNIAQSKIRILAIEAMEIKIGKHLYRGLLKNVARVWSPQQIQETPRLEKVLAQMQGAERGMARLEAAQARLAPETVQRITIVHRSVP